MDFKGKRLMPTYLIDFLKDIYPGDIPANFGKRMVSRQLIAYIQQMYSLFGGKSIDNFGRDMCPEYLIKYLEYLINADYIEYEDDTVAYKKETPENALKYAFLNYVGGMSYKCLNLCNKDVVFENTERPTLVTTVYYTSLKLKPNTNYTFSTNVPNSFGDAGIAAYLFILSGSVTSGASTNGNGVWNGQTRTVTSDSDGYITIGSRYQMVGYQGVTSFDNYEIILNEGATVLPYQPYFEGIRESLVTSVNSLALKNNDDK